MTDEAQPQDDVALDALATLSEVAEESAKGLSAISTDLTEIQDHRKHGWTWRRIADDRTANNLLSVMSGIAIDLARASGAFRRSLARSLRHEGMRVSEIGTLLGVSRQRIGALVRPKR